jgi:hypothetical protein
MKDTHNVCERPVDVREDLRIPKCMDMITPEDVIRRVEVCYHGGVLQYGTQASSPEAIVRTTTIQPDPTKAVGKPRRLRQPSTNVLIKFRHGLGDAVQLTIVLKHLRRYRPDWNVDVAALVGKHSACHGLCRQVFVLDRNGPVPSDYGQVFGLDWHECTGTYGNCPSTKPARCLKEVFGQEPSAELFG